MQNETVNIDVEKRIDNIKAYAFRKSQELKAQIKRKFDLFYELNNQIRSLSPRVKDMLDVAYCCYENHIPLDAFKKSNSISQPISFEISSGRIMLALDIPTNAAVGMYAGSLGLCNWNGISILTLKDSLNLSSYNDVMEQFVNSFDKFEADFYKYVDSIVLDNSVISCRT